jgi:small multidrug resistance family-3 protein
MEITKSLLIFLLAGLCEIGGGYLVWQWIREDKPWWIGILGMFILGLYGIVATWQPSNFGRVYAAYGGFFVIMSVLWAYKFDNSTPDKYDMIGVAMVLLGTVVIFFAPRN